MTCHSKALIYYMTARVAFKKRKKVHERVVWIVSVFDTPSDIQRYDSKTKRIGLSNLTVDEHKKQDKAEV